MDTAPHDPGGNAVGPSDLKAVLREEWDEIGRRRRFLAALRDYVRDSSVQNPGSAQPGSDEPPHPPPDNLMGLALSGGGIRSATFCLGAAQALSDQGVLAGFDYLSTVSGGGYFGGWWSAWLSREPYFTAADLSNPWKFLNELLKAGHNDNSLASRVSDSCQDAERQALHEIWSRGYVTNEDVRFISEVLNRVISRKLLYDGLPDESDSTISKSFKVLKESVHQSGSDGGKVSDGDPSTTVSWEGVFLNRLLLEEHFKECFRSISDPRRMAFPYCEEIEQERHNSVWPGTGTKPAELPGQKGRRDEPRQFPVAAEQHADGSANVWYDPIHHLRLFANYLTPRRGALSGDTWRAAAVVTRNLALAWMVLIPILMAVMLLGQLYFLGHPSTSPDFIHERPIVATSPGDTTVAAQRDTAAVREKHSVSSAHVLLVRAGAAVQPLLPIVGWIILVVIAWIMNGQEAAALRNKVMPWVELIAVVNWASASF